MQLVLDTLKKEEQITLSLRKLFEQHGYKKFKVRKFESYDLYVENKKFLLSDNIITFNDTNGRLLALKPDVTLSIVKNTRATRQNSQKLYYIENVYRLARQTHEYKEINQMGLEFLGDVDPYSTIEVVRLAINSLSEISPRFILSLSHMGFVSALLEELVIEQDQKAQLITCLRNKNTHELQQLARKMHIAPLYRDKLVAICSLCGNFPKTLAAASDLVINDKMQTALDQLTDFYQAISFSEFAKNIQLDFSLINDLDYYSGLIFQGYIEGIPRPVLTGGRYDNLMQKFGKDIGAIGFAIYLNELEHYCKTALTYDVDALILYQPGDDYGKLSCEVQKMVQNGLSVQVEKNIPDELRYKKIYAYKNNQLEEVALHA